jgi:hypothetical protein
MVTCQLKTRGLNRYAPDTASREGLYRERFKFDSILSEMPISLLRLRRPRSGVHKHARHAARMINIAQNHLGDGLHDEPPSMSG